MWGHYCYLRGSPDNLYCYRKCMGHYCMKIATLQSVISSYHLYTLCQHSCCAGYNVLRIGVIFTCCLFSFPVVFPMATHFSTCKIFTFYLFQLISKSGRNICCNIVLYAIKNVTELQNYKILIQAEKYRTLLFQMHSSI